MPHFCPDAVKVTPLEWRTLLVEFADGSVKACDMAELGGVFARLNDREFFRKAHVETGAVVWDETLDIAPEYLYEHGKDIL